METGWPAVLSAASGAFSAIAALAAVFIAIRNERRSREITKAQMYLTLREGFLSIYKELGELEDAQDANARLRRAREAYWHHAYDEWRLSRMAPRELGDLWNEFFRRAVQSGYTHSPLRRTFDDLRGNEKAGFGLYAKDFIADFLKDLPPEHQDAPGVAFLPGLRRTSPGMVTDPPLNRTGRRAAGHKLRGASRAAPWRAGCADTCRSLGSPRPGERLPPFKGRIEPSPRIPLKGFRPHASRRRSAAH